jgi:hypothetical protein
LASDAAKIDDAVVFAQACGLDIAKCDGREHLWIGRNRFVPYSDAARWPNVSAERLAEDPGSARPERHFPSGAAQTRIVSVAGIRLDPRKSVRSFKGIICGDISEFASYMPSHAVGSLPANMPARCHPARFGALARGHAAAPPKGGLSD